MPLSLFNIHTYTRMSYSSDYSDSLWSIKNEYDARASVLRSIVIGSLVHSL